MLKVTILGMRRFCTLLLHTITWKVNKNDLVRLLLTLGEELGFCLTLLLRDTEAVANTVYFPVTVS